MGKLLLKLRRITLGSIEKLLNGLEEPDVILPALIQELEQKVHQAEAALAKAIASKKRRADEVAGTEKEIKELNTGAEKFVGKGDDSKARAAITKRLGLEANLQRLRVQLGDATNAETEARQALEHIKSVCDEVKAKQRDLVQRAKHAESQRSITEAVARAQDGGEILDVVAQLEDKVAASEALAQVQRDSSGVKPDISKEVKTMLTKEKVDAELAKLKAKAKKKGKK